MTNRHAYLIMAHANFQQLAILLRLLDDERNDIFVHIDKRSLLNEEENKALNNVLQKSKLRFIKSRKVSWAGDSLMKVEMDLLKEAVHTPHKYYHLLSGADLPLKTQSYIHKKLDDNDKDYIAVESNHQHNITKNFLDRFRYYYPLQNTIGRPTGRKWEKTQNKLLSIQKKLKIDRTRNAKLEYVKGSQWFSITHDTAMYIINHYHSLKKFFLNSFVPDESFVQTIVMNSPLKNNIVDDNLRCIDWQRGSPYTFKNEDYQTLIGSEKLFARKFDINVDKDIIIRIQNYLKD